MLILADILGVLVVAVVPLVELVDPGPLVLPILLSVWVLALVLSSRLRQGGRDEVGLHALLFGVVKQLVLVGIFEDSVIGELNLQHILKD